MYVCMYAGMHVCIHIYIEMDSDIHVYIATCSTHLSTWDLYGPGHRPSHLKVVVPNDELHLIPSVAEPQPLR